MQFSIVGLLTFFALIGSVLSIPIAERESSLTKLEARAISVHPTFTGGLTDIEIPAITAADRASAKALKKKQNAITSKTASQKAMVARQQQALARVAALLNAAATTLQLSGTLNVDITNFFHVSKSDKENHATFGFNAPICALRCAGHAYNPTSEDGQLGRIFNEAGDSIFGGQPQKP
ncbi:hypothetical protein GLOTRDRAFT_134035 [Gloeophyllum trabeum ATCC 11539]|uniref:Uncharacterized protein n=1 Tax=Gloeophyllum trabeum (strain ATCC 11539 / FP-39264 / Madison 617) TaxID=670483 RepID=S7PSH6_GLOTA|nr:uncharacterized protein GLOTRDRAFT_134035 [Gloeophyllum trabeum ATCC 11539]EPQ50368.1 hypothetical protein GLOTRDRAFT_134035 [Gloeophyllum trabeum ATCC 11539]